MQGPDSCSESLFTTMKLEDFVPAAHPPRPIRTWTNGALASRFVGLAVEDTVWSHPVFGQSRERLSVHDAANELINVTVEMTDKRGLRSGGHFSVQGTSIQAWASHNSMRRKDGADDARSPEDWRGGPRSIDAQESTPDPESRRYRARNAAAALPSCHSHVLSGNRHGLVANVQARSSDGTAERDVAAQMLAVVAAPGKRVTVGGDKAYDTKGFVEACREISVTPHVAHNINRKAGSAISGRTTQHAGYEVNQRKRIEQCFGWGKRIGPICSVMVQGLDKVDQLLTLTMAAYKLTRPRTLAQ